MPSGVSASPQGLRWPDSRGRLPRIPQRPGRGAGTASKGPGGTPSSRAGQAACSGQAGLWRGRRDKRRSQGTGGLGLSLEADGVLSGMHPAHAPETLALVQGPLPTQAHTGLRGTQSHPEFHTVTRLHTHRRDRRLWGLRQRLLCCSCPTMWGGG